MKKDRKNLSRKEGSRGHNLKRDFEFLGDLKKKIKEDSTKSMNRLSDELDGDEGTIRRVVKEDLGVSSYTRIPRHLLTDTLKERRLQSCKKVRAWIKANGSMVNKFSGKKSFTVDLVDHQRRSRGCSIENIRPKQGSFLSWRPTIRRWLPFFLGWGENRRGGLLQSPEVHHTAMTQGHLARGHCEGVEQLF
uniref:Uncharacterized protein n=1 Tax=Lepeophtheirus salmonis TaxID=72036 RepID=A0A0K2T504_LEPSM